MSVTRIVMKSLRDGTVRWLVLLGVAGLMAGAGLLTAGTAMAAVGTVPGGMQLLQTGLVVTTGPLTTTTTWSSTTACPAGFQTSAEITEWATDGTEISSISPVTGTGLASAGFKGTLLATPGAILSRAGIDGSSPGTVEWVIGCYSLASGTGSVKYIGDTYISVASGASVFTTSPTATGSPSTTATHTPTSTPTSTPTHTPTSTPTSTPTHTPTSTPTSTATSTESENPTATSSVLPSGAPGTGAGGSSFPSGPSAALIALGVALLAGSAAAMGLAARRARLVAGDDGPGDINQDGGS